MATLINLVECTDGHISTCAGSLTITKYGQLGVEEVPCLDLLEVLPSLGMQNGFDFLLGLA